MGLKTTGRYCAHCGQQVLAQRNAPNHVLHLILTLITFGLWTPIWLIVTLASAGNWRCTRCGNRV